MGAFQSFNGVAFRWHVARIVWAILVHRMCWIMCYTHILLQIVIRVYFDNGIHIQGYSMLRCLHLLYKIIRNLFRKSLWFRGSKSESEQTYVSSSTSLTYSIVGVIFCLLWIATIYTQLLVLHLPEKEKKEDSENVSKNYDKWSHFFWDERLETVMKNELSEFVMIIGLAANSLISQTECRL